ncbi:MAG: nucleotidyltransferase substrate binding protein [Thiocapsa sp.]|uniref:nucleotidyltransferase substrate binding protein n=1 Tax=Thiocapsa sp. TaxID=2024551 RepID=UPI001BD0F18F|nr:nucleotidyltransferase substrate binding protein [Thiocapsa sp.]QVL48395.1 MAG: nucleotidyltransferase substrate binding protein [Thiocapsa sp.]
MSLNFDHLERWLQYRDSRNDTTHDYGEIFAERTLLLITDFQRDAKALHVTLRQKHGKPDA